VEVEMKKYVVFILSLLSAVAFADTYTFQKGNNKVDWTAVGTPGFLRINGEGGYAVGVLNAVGGKVSGTLAVPLDAYKTGIALRDEHLKKKYMETGKYPEAKMVIKDQPYVEGKEGILMADLTLKDTTKPVKVYFTVTGKKVAARFKVSIKDFPSIGVPSHLGVTMADEVEVKVDGTL
jgi:polyisoprenoid-binding protein YceI